MTRRIVTRRIISAAVATVAAVALFVGLEGQVPTAGGSWTSTGSMPGAREEAASVLLDDGQVLVLGGRDAEGAVASGLVYSGGRWSTVESPIQRWSHTATNLSRRHPLAKAPEGDAVTGVVVIGGESAAGLHADVDLLDPATNQVRVLGHLDVARKGHAATLLADGRILIAGGFDGKNFLSSLELLDPATGRVTPAQHPSTGEGIKLSGARAGLTATTLLDGRVMLAGGYDGVNDLGNVEIINLATGSVTRAAMTAPRRNHQALLLPNNNTVLLVGGASSDQVLASAEIYVPWLGQFRATGPMGEARHMGTGASLAGERYGIASELRGKALVAGGEGAPSEQGNPKLSSTELYGGFTTVMTEKDDYLPGQTVTMTGTGWKPGETVTLYVREVPAEHGIRDFVAVADEAGNIRNTDLVLEDHDLGVRFYLTAVGEQSKSEARTTFTDGTATVSGMVTDSVTGNAIPGASISCSCSGKTEKTDAAGKYSYKVAFGNDGIETLTASKVGFTSASEKVTPVTQTRDFSLKPTTTATTVTASSTTTTYGDASVTLSATVSPNTVDVGTVKFTVKSGATTIGTTTSGTVSAGAATATFSLSGVKAGTYTIEAVYSGGTGFTSSGNSSQSPAPELTVSPKGITGSFTTSSKGYDGNTSATATGRSLNDVVGSDVVTLEGGTATFSDKNVGSAKTVTLTGATLGGTAAGNYTLSSVATTTANITAKGVTGSFTAADKVYDGSASASISGRSLQNAINGDDVSLTSGTASFDNKKVGANKPVTGSGFALAGTDKDNYSLGPVANAKASITAKGVTGSFTASDKVYDGNATAAISERALQGTIGADAVSLSGGTASFDNKNVAADKPVTGSGFALAGTDKDNYSLGAVANTTASIMAKGVTGSFTASDKVYDGNATAAISERALRGAIVGDAVSLSGGTASFDNKNVGPDKPVTGSKFELAGDDKNNYSLGAVANTTASITAKGVTGSFTASDKDYDGNATAAISERALRGAIVGDAVSLSGGTASFDNKNVGPDKPVTGSRFELAGVDKDNYILGSVANTTASITRRELTVGAVGVSKVYDGKTLASVNLTSNEVDGDQLDLAYTGASFTDKHVGNDKAVSVTGVSMSGVDASNYNLLNTSAEAKADIKPLQITVTAVTDSKVYNGTKSSTGIPSITSGTLVAGDTVSWAQSFDSKNVGTEKTLTPAGAVNDGNGGKNYSVTFNPETTGVITPLDITGSFTAGDKVYDGTTNAQVSGHVLNGAVDADNVSLSGGTASFNNKLVGEKKPVNGTGFVLAGDDKINYTLTSVSNTTASITARALMVSAAGVNKEYDGNISATVMLSDNRVTGDLLTTAYSGAAFADRNVGLGKTVSVAGISVAGTDAANYSFNMTAVANADIKARPITVTADAKSKSFGAGDPPLTYQITSGSLVAGDSFTGSLTRSTVEAVGSYEILQGNVSAGPNYNLGYVGAKLTIRAWTPLGFHSPIGIANSFYRAPGDAVPAATPTTVWQTAKGGSTVPLKFNMFADGVEKTSIADVKGFGAVKLAGCTGSTLDPVEELLTAGSTSLRYDGAAGQFIQNWKTGTVAGDTCYRVTVTLQDSTSIHTFVRLRK